MYTPTHFEESRIEVLHELIRTHPLASLITHSESGLNANHIPLQLKSGPESPASPEGALSYGILCGHMARANPLWQEVSEEPEVLAIFHGPQSYITPSWYASKEETGKVVPTWNYAVVNGRQARISQKITRNRSFGDSRMGKHRRKQ